MVIVYCTYSELQDLFNTDLSHTFLGSILEPRPGLLEPRLAIYQDRFSNQINKGWVCHLDMLRQVYFSDLIEIFHVGFPPIYSIHINRTDHSLIFPGVFNRSDTRIPHNDYNSDFSNNPPTATAEALSPRSLCKRFSNSHILGSLNLTSFIHRYIYSIHQLGLPK